MNENYNLVQASLALQSYRAGKNASGTQVNSNYLTKKYSVEYAI